MRRWDYLIRNPLFVIPPACHWIFVYIKLQRTRNKQGKKQFPGRSARKETEKETLHVMRLKTNNTPLQKEPIGGLITRYNHQTDNYQHCQHWASHKEREQAAPRPWSRWVFPPKRLIMYWVSSVLYICALMCRQHKDKWDPLCYDICTWPCLS